MTTRNTDLQAAAEAVAANPSDAGAIMRLQRLVGAKDIVAVPGPGLTNDEIKLQQGVGARIAQGSLPGTGLVYATSDIPAEAHENLLDAMGKVTDLSGNVATQETVEKFTNYTKALADSDADAGTMVPAGMVETTVGTVHTFTEGGEVPAGPLTTSAIASAVDAPAAENQDDLGGMNASKVKTTKKDDSDKAAADQAKADADAAKK